MLASFGNLIVQYNTPFWCSRIHVAIWNNQKYLLWNFYSFFASLRGFWCRKHMLLLFLSNIFILFYKRQLDHGYLPIVLHFKKLHGFWCILLLSFWQVHTVPHQKEYSKFLLFLTNAEKYIVAPIFQKNELRSSFSHAYWTLEVYVIHT